MVLGMNLEFETQWLLVRQPDDQLNLMHVHIIIMVVRFQIAKFKLRQYSNGEPLNFH